MSTIGFIGGGNMAEALIKGLLSAKLYKPQDILVGDILKERLDFFAKQYGVKTSGDNADLATKADVIVFAVKPQKMAEALAGIKGAMRIGALVVSIAAGVKTAKIAAVLGDVPIVRVMPNTPALIGEGASALFANEKAKPMLDKALKIFSAVGRAVVVDNEDLIDAVTVVSGSGPAYFFLLMEEMIATGRKLGLPDNVAKDLVLQTAKGAALLAAERDKAGEPPAVLRQKVTSPGGTTEAALKTLAAGGFSKLINDALAAACKRSKELAG